MNGLVKTRQTGKILVDLNVSSGIELSVRAATTLAAAVGADVHGLFIQEESMLDLAALPFSCAVTMSAAQTVELSPKSMMKAFQRHSARSRRELSRQAELASVSWSFSIERGDLQQKIQDALSIGDYLVLGSNGHGFRSRRLLNQLVSGPAGTRGVVLTPSRQTRSVGGPVVIVDNDNNLSQDALTLAARIALLRTESLHLFLVASNESEGMSTINRASETLQSGQKLVVHRFLPHTPQTVAATLKQIQPGFVVADLPATPLEGDPATLDLFRSAGAPIVFLKSEEVSEEHTNSSAVLL